MAGSAPPPPPSRASDVGGGGGGALEADAYVRRYLADPDNEQAASVAVAEYLRSNPSAVTHITHMMMNERHDNTTRQSGKAGGRMPMSRAKSDPRSKFQSLLKLSGQPEQHQGVLAANELSSENPDTKRLIGMPHEHLMMELIRDIANEMDVTLLCVKVIRNVLLLIGAERASLFLVRETSDGEKRLVSLLFDVTIDSSLEDILARDKERFEVPFKRGILGTVAATKIPIICNDPYKEPMFNAEMDKKSGFTTKCLMCAPLLDADGELLGVAEVLNKIESPSKSPNKSSSSTTTKPGFTADDQDTFLSYLMFCALGFINAELFQYSINEFKANRTLLRLAKEIFCEGFNINRTGAAILSEAARAFGISDYVLYLVDALDNPWNRYTLFQVGERQKLSNAVNSMNMTVLSKQVKTADDLKFVQRLRVSRKAPPTDPAAAAADTAGGGGAPTDRPSNIMADGTSTNKDSAWMKIQRKARHQMSDQMNATGSTNWRASQLTKLNERMELLNDELSDDLEGNVKFDVETSSDAKHLTQGRFVYLAKNCVIQNLHIDVSGGSKTGWPDNVEAIDEGEQSAGVHSVLVKPVYDSSQRHVLGVMVIINRDPSHVFNQFERERLMTFFLYAGLGLQFAFIHERMMITLAKQEVALEVLAFHRTADEQELRRFFSRYPNVPLLDQLRAQDLMNISYDDFPLHEDETVIHMFNMFKCMKATETFKIDDHKLAKFILTVKRSYRPVAYHNWRHGLNVCQSMFVLLKGNPKLERFFDDRVRLYLLIATLCHDLDHRGTNNQFQTKTSSPLAFLYSTSTLEKHHFDQTMLIINSEETNLLSNMPADTYFEAMAIIEHAIISTDLALYFKKKAKFLELVASPSLKEMGEKFWKIDENNQMLRAMLMTACDLSAICKPWAYQSRVAKIVYEEFFEQGDIEKKAFGNTADMFNRDNKDQLPKMQLGFIDFVCKPLYDALNSSFPNCDDMLKGALNNRAMWNEEKNKMDARREAKLDIISWHEELDWPEGHEKFNKHKVKNAAAAGGVAGEARGGAGGASIESYNNNRRQAGDSTTAGGREVVKPKKSGGCWGCCGGGGSKGRDSR